MVSPTRLVVVERDGTWVSSLEMATGFSCVYVQTLGRLWHGRGKLR